MSAVTSRRVIGLLSTVLGCGALFVTPAAASPAAVARTGVARAPITKVVYTPESGGIWVANANGTGDHEISTVHASSVSFSPDGTKIAYTFNAVWTIPVAGGTAHRLTPAGGTVFDASWSPNGHWIAYSMLGSPRYDIYRIPATGGSATRLTFGGRQGCDDTQPSWSPNSAAIAFRQAIVGSACPSAGLGVQPVGGTAHVVVSGNVSSPSFTPVGNLVYLAYDEDYFAYVGWEANVDGTGQQLVDHDDDCNEGDRCLSGMVGAARVHGWMQVSTYGSEDGPTGTCFVGAYQQAGRVESMPPGFCVDNRLVGPSGADAF